MRQTGDKIKLRFDKGIDNTTGAEDSFAVSFREFNGAEYIDKSITPKATKPFATLDEIPVNVTDGQRNHTAIDGDGVVLAVNTANSTRAWGRDSGFTFFSNSTTRTNGWRFVPLTSILVPSVRLYSSHAGSTKIHFWDSASTSAPIWQKSVSVSIGWNVYTLDDPLLLAAGKTYTITANFPLGGGYDYFNIETDSRTGSSVITNVENWRINKADKYPTERATGGYCPAIDFSFCGYYSSGTIEYELDECQAISSVLSSKIEWGIDRDDYTNVVIKTKVGGDYSNCVNGGRMVGVEPGMSMTTKTLKIQASFVTTDLSKTPRLNWIRFTIRDTSDANSMVLVLGTGNTDGIRNAVDAVTVSYDGLGGVTGDGNVRAFEESFTPVGLVSKPHQKPDEHIAMSLTPTGNLMRIYYNNAAEPENIAVGLTATAVLTDIRDI